MELNSSTYVLTMDEVKLLTQKNHSSVIVMDNNGNIRLCNQAFILLTGYSEEDVVHKSISQFIPGIYDVQIWINAYMYSIESRQQNLENPVVEIKTRNETSRTSEFSIQKLRYPDDNQTYMITFHDMNLCQGHSLFQRFSDSFMRDVNL